MLELAFNLTNDPLFYIVTMTVLINLSGISATVFLYKHLNSQWFEKPEFSCKQGFNVLESQGRPVFFGKITAWMAKFVCRRESPQDDSEDHVSFLDFAC